MSIKLLEDEIVAEVPFVKAIWAESGSAIAALQKLEAYMPLNSLIGNHCKVCGLPVEHGDICGDICANLKGWFSLQFITYSNARVLEPIMLSLKNSEKSDIWQLDFFHQLIAESHLNSMISGDVTIWMLAPNRLGKRSWPLNDALWGAWVSSDVGSQYLIPKELEQRPPRGQISSLVLDFGEDIDLKDKTVIVLDDFWTTGATLGSIAHELRRLGAKKVLGFTIGRQIRPDSPYKEKAYRQLKDTNHGI